MNLEIVKVDFGYQAVILSDGGNVIDRVAPCPTRAAAVVAGVQMYPRAVCCHLADEDEVTGVALWNLLTLQEREQALRDGSSLVMAGDRSQCRWALREGGQRPDTEGWSL